MSLQCACSSVADLVAGGKIVNTLALFPGHQLGSSVTQAGMSSRKLDPFLDQ